MHKKIINNHILVHIFSYKLTFFLIYCRPIVLSNWLKKISTVLKKIFSSHQNNTYLILSEMILAAQQWFHLLLYISKIYSTENAKLANFSNLIKAINSKIFCEMRSLDIWKNEQYKKCTFICITYTEESYFELSTFDKSVNSETSKSGK